jgi:hypothetical protein
MIKTAQAPALHHHILLSKATVRNIVVVSGREWYRSVALLVDGENTANGSDSHWLHVIVLHCYNNSRFAACPTIIHLRRYHCRSNAMSLRLEEFGSIQLSRNMYF